MRVQINKMWPQINKLWELFLKFVATISVFFFCMSWTGLHNQQLNLTSWKSSLLLVKRLSLSMCVYFIFHVLPLIHSLTILLSSVWSAVRNLKVTWSLSVAWIIYSVAVEGLHPYWPFYVSHPVVLSLLLALLDVRLL